MDFSLGELRSALHDVQRDLLGFLRAVTDWSRRFGPDDAAGIVLFFDQALRITEPLEWG